MKEGNRLRWDGRASNPVGGATRRREGSTPSPFRHWRSLTAALLAVVAGVAAAAEPIETTVRRDGDKIIVDIKAQVAARPGLVFAVLTDYDRMAEYVKSLKSSAVIARHGNVVHVAQSGETRVAFMRFSFSTVRAVELVGEEEFHSRLIRGDFKSYDSSTRLHSEGGRTTIVSHGEYVPTAWIPPMIGPSMIEAEIRRQYQALTAEMLRRQALEPKP